MKTTILFILAVMCASFAGDTLWTRTTVKGTAFGV